MRDVEIGRFRDDVKDILALRGQTMNNGSVTLASR